ncbi:MAG TPA: sugar ABC transporter substrate-binding protein [Methylomirabilota bacterium]|jgi:ribose transport system substrate-binding protein|nr:sugar ABC transporter substrate-binding protein [Methylomirabilota bacterium]
MASLAPAARPGRRRRAVLLVACAITALFASHLAGADERRYTIAFANLIEEPGVTLEATGFTGRDVRESLLLAARVHPIDLVLYDNGRDCARAPANVEDAVSRKVDLFIQYCHSADVNAVVAEKLKAARIPVIAVNEPLAGAPLYTLDNGAAGRIAGDALGDFALRTWRGRPLEAAIVGSLAGRGVPERAHGVQERLRHHLPAVRITRLDTQGNPAQVAGLVGRFLAARPGAKVLVAAMDDTTALACKSALEAAGRLSDAAVVSHGADRSIRGGMSERKEIDPNNRGSIVLGSVAFYLDRVGYAVLPLALRMLRGQPTPPRTVTPHRLITAANVFVEYPPYDMQ